MENIFSKRKNKKQGFTLIELLIVFTILIVITVGTVTLFLNFRNQQGLDKDTELIVQVLSQARSQTLTSQNASQYGVHFAAAKIILFTGGTYVAGNASNQDFPLASSDTILTILLSGGGNDVIFNRLSGETVDDGRIVVSSPSIAHTKTVTIYKTGLVESN